jgi:hypothetical protein
MSHIEWPISNFSGALGMPLIESLLWNPGAIGNLWGNTLGTREKNKKNPVPPTSQKERNGLFMSAC